MAMTAEHEHHWSPSVHEPTSVIGTAVVALVAYEVVATTVNTWIDADVVPSLMPRLQNITPRSVARAVTPQWSRYAGWIAVGATGTVVAGVIRSALPARRR